MKTLLIKLSLISSLVLSDSGIAAEDIIFSGGSPHIKTLAASCAACHGTQGNAVGNNQPNETLTLAGVDREHLVERLMAFRSGTRTSTVMYHHARGLTLEEIKQLGDYFSQQKVEKRYPPQSQQLKAEQ